jgi:diacylglycerol O-acyltransferase
MERLTGLDASFLYAETPSVHMHTIKVAILDPLPDAGENTFERFRAELGDRLHLLPRFRRRVVETPLRFHRAVWIEDPDFDLDFHLKHVAVPEPGGRDELNAVIADIASHPLHPGHPLWEIWRVDGLADGGTAYVAKIHHSLADGVASARLLANIMEFGPDEPGTKPDAAWAPEPVPSKAHLLVDALKDHVRKFSRLPSLLFRTFQGLWRLIRRRLSGAPSPPMPYNGPVTRLNRRLSPARSFATVSVPLDEVRAIKRALSVTLNDVVLAIAAGALKRFLSHYGETPDRSLVAAVPIATGPADAPERLVGNRLSNVFTILHTDIEDPVERVRAINETMAVAKDANEQMGSDIMREWMEYVPPGLHSWFANLVSKLEFPARHRPPANAIVSNVRGPDRPLYIAGMKLRSLYSIGPVVDGIGINITAWSYSDDLAFTVLASRNSVTDAREVTKYITDSFQELRERCVDEAGANERHVDSASVDLGT